MSGVMIRAEGLGKTVQTANGPCEILRGIELQIARGSTVALVGASGSGKTSLLSILAGLDTPSVGRVTVDGQDLFAWDEDARAAWRGRCTGFVFQQFQLLSGLTALENAMLPLELAGRRDARAVATVFLQRVGLGDRLHHLPKCLSGGEQQRVALARAFVGQPALLFADEPTGSLDAATGAQVVDEMFSLHREQGSTLVLVTHDLALAARCQHQIRLEAGQIQAPQTLS